MTSYVGYCGPAISSPTQWGSGDVIGTLLVEEGFGWYAAGHHYSSSPGYAECDIRRLFERRDDPQPDDSYEWLGQRLHADVGASYPPAPMVLP